VTARSEANGFRPPAAYRNAHLQSVAAHLPPRRRWIRTAAADLLGRSEQTIVAAGDGVRLGGAVARASGESRGLVVMLHGWEGCAESSYMLSAGAALLAAGFDVFRLNLRDHGDTHHLNEGLFHSCRIDEVVAAVASIQRTLEPRRLALVGHSLGANFALRVAVRAPGHGIAIARVFAVAPVLRPAATMRALEEGFWLYRHYFLHRWRRSLYRKAELFPALYRFGDLRRLPTLTATTDFFVREYTEFPTLGAYLDGYALTGDRLADLTVPARAVFAADDPVIPVGDIDRLARPAALAIELVRHGGHCGFIEGLSRPRWVDAEMVADLLRWM